MNILLVNPPYSLSPDSPASKTGAILPPLGLLYLAAYLRKKHAEINIQILDAPAYKLTYESFGKRLLDFCPDVVGIVVYTTTFINVLQTIKIVKEVFPDCLIVAGGAHASILPEECLDSPYIDIVVLGEGEETFAQLVECITHKGDLAKVPNIAYKEDDKIARSFNERRIVDLDRLPYPARDLLDMSIYRPGYGTFTRAPSTNMITSRGCPFQCSFCSKNIFGSFYRAQSAQKTIGEIESLVRDYGIKEIIFNDDIFTYDIKNIEELCDLLIKERLDLTWSCNTRVNLVNRHLLEKMRKSGCVAIGYGIEAGNRDILKNISKGFSFERAKEAIQCTKQAGIETRAFYILGFLGETKATLRETLDTALELDTDFVIFNLAIPMPGTTLYEEAKSQSLLLYDGKELYKRTDGPHPLIKLEDVSEAELIQFYQRAYKRYYFRPRHILRHLMRMRSLYDIKRNISGFSYFLSWVRESFFEKKE